MSEITRARNVRSVVGTARRLRALPSHVEIETEYGGVARHAHYDYVVVARGFDPLWFTSLFDEEMSRQLGAATGHPTEGAIERAIRRDLAVEGLAPRLHLPMLAAVAQGPGFPNLSCLGLLADRVLSSYVPLLHLQHVQQVSAQHVSSDRLPAAPVAVVPAGDGV
jgi:mycobactin lysine-N-oxygenase